MNVRETLLALSCVVSANDGGWAAADEMRHAWRREGYVYSAQTIGSKLAALERRGLVESRQEDWGKMWRLSSQLRDMLQPLHSSTTKP